MARTKAVPVKNGAEGAKKPRQTAVATAKERKPHRFHAGNRRLRVMRRLQFQAAALPVLPRRRVESNLRRALIETGAKRVQGGAVELLREAVEGALVWVVRDALERMDDGVRITLRPYHLRVATRKYAQAAPGYLPQEWFDQPNAVARRLPFVPKPDKKKKKEKEEEQP